MSVLAACAALSSLLLMALKSRCTSCSLEVRIACSVGSCYVLSRHHTAQGSGPAELLSLEEFQDGLARRGPDACGIRLVGITAMINSSQSCWVITRAAQQQWVLLAHSGVSGTWANAALRILPAAAAGTASRSGAPRGLHRKHPPLQRQAGHPPPPRACSMQVTQMC